MFDTCQSEVCRNTYIGSADRFAFVHDARGTLQQRPVDDVTVPYDPANVRCSPPHVTWLNVKNVAQTPLKRNRVTSVVSDYSFRIA